MRKTLLVHGAWHTGDCWKELINALKTHGNDVCALTLPGHAASEQENLERIGLSTYKDAVLHYLDTLKEPVHLVGHSMSGIVLLEVASVMPEKIASLHFISAFIPKPRSESIFDISTQFASKGLGPYLKVETESNRLILEKSSQVGDILYGENITFPGRSECIASLVDQPLSPMGAKVNWSPDIIKKISNVQVIICTEDKCVPPHEQIKMANNLPHCNMAEINAAHSPEITCPEKLAELLISAMN
ncbi:MAG: hypothetical protein CMF48_01965 [Legionellales bacterium]|nr:hypothetical protein [Legionellales bacterium]